MAEPEEIVFTKTITGREVSHMVEKVLGRVARNIEIGGDRVRLIFDPPLNQVERQALDQRFSKMGYYLIEYPPPEEEPE